MSHILNYMALNKPKINVRLMLHHCVDSLLSLMDIRSCYVNVMSLFYWVWARTNPGLDLTKMV